MATAKYTWQMAIVVRILKDIINNASRRKFKKIFVNSKVKILKNVFRRYVFSLLPLRPAK